MEAKDIDKDGNWTYLGHTESLLGATLPIPENVRKQGGGAEEQEVLMLIDAKSQFSETCPECKSELPDDTIILIMPHAKMMPVKCCNSIIWMTDRRGNYGRTDYT